MSSRRQSGLSRSSTFYGQEGICTRLWIRSPSLLAKGMSSHILDAATTRVYG